MKKRVRKGFSLLLALVMVFSLLPAQAMAEEPEGSIAPVEDPTPPEDGGQSDQENAPDAEVEGSIAPAPDAEIQAASGTCGDNAVWTLSADGLLTISGTGEVNSHPWTDSYPTDVKRAVVGSGITSLCDNAFRNCTAMTDAHYADSVTELGSYAFQNCTALVKGFPRSFRRYPTQSLTAA